MTCRACPLVVALQKEIAESCDATTVANLAEALKRASVKPEERGEVPLFAEA